MGYHDRDLKSFVTAVGDGIEHMDLAVEGVRCAGCMAKIEKGLGTVPGITRARLNFTNRRLAVEWRAGALAPADVVEKLAALGYRAHPFDPAAAAGAEAAESRRLMKCMAVAGFAAMNVMLLSVSVWSGNVTDITPEIRDLFHWLSALIAIPAVAYAGRPFFESAIGALMKRTVNMDVPITLGVLLAVGMSVVETFNGGRHAYFDAAVMLLFFLLVGRFLDMNMRRRTRAQAENLAALKGETATKVLPDGSTRVVPVSAIDPGDRVLVAAGERLSVDGVIETGSTEIDNSLVTGETAYAAAGPGDRVYAGTLNMTGALTVQVTAAAKGTLLDEVNTLLDAAQTARSTRLALADKAAGYYAPLVHSAAALTFVGWMIAGSGWQEALMTAIAVLIITCPCALGLAVPAVQVVASGLLFRSGVLLNAGDAVERFAEADTVVFDKTGTLTSPEPTLVDPAATPQARLGRAGRLALSSRHPLSAALKSYATSPVPDATEEPGQGVRAEIDGVACRLGSAAFCGVSAEKAAETAESGAHSLVWYREGEADAIPIAVAQGLRPDAADVIARLKDRGITVMILSGDRAAAVDAAADALGVADRHAGLKPADKIAILEELKDQGHKVLMVGDGLNDAPALAAAHVSMSPVTAVHLSQAAADAVFLGDKLGPVVTAIDISRRARRAMDQNLWFAAFYNVCAVPIAVLGFVTPLVAALAMSSSSVVVTLNALRVRLIARKLEGAS
ncbi:heavy metal translocating P-type ATPase [Microbaculum marinisediminis]|uniref:Heavy metal translocating P-type ATPase n=1 Tax=Microbaculum marinisediminis TaxID=2931392 RepID=A0AAW5QWH1_9HYPH|nr:heavy metal translocating P-type ATPase [Microbaculum sp. A6E488]MCT8970640.1 heavy metal translocating P-type ATPase [Microbaculum sp. A6E488]